MDKIGVGIVTTTITTTSGAGISSGSSVNYDTVHEETTTIYTTTTQTHTSTSTIGTGISSDTSINYDTVYQQTTTVYSTTTLTTTSTQAVDCTSSGILTYSTVVTSSTTETIAVDITSSDGVYYTKLVTTTNPGGGDAGGGEASILSVSSALSDALHLVGTGDSDTSSVQGGIKPVELTSTEAITYRDWDYDGDVTTDYILRLVDSSNENSQHTTTLNDFGVSTTNYITVQNGSTTTTIVVDSNTYFSKGYYYDYSGYKKYNEASNNLVQMLEEVGIKTYVTNGKVSFVGDNTHYILGMTADLRVALNMDSGVGYTVISDSTSGGESSGGSTSYISTIFISSSASNVALSSVGVNTTNYITVQNGATTSIVTVDASTTVNQLASALAAVGITTDVTNGKFTFSGDSTHYITGMTTNLKSAQNLMGSGGVGYTVRTVETTSTQTVTLASAASYADLNTKLSTLNITDGTFTVYRNGEKILLNIEADDTFNDIRSMLASKYSDLDLKFEDGYLVFYSKDDDVSVEVGNTTDTSNFLAVTGLNKNEKQVRSARALYTVNSDSLVTADGIFRAGKVTTGSFTIGTAKINIDANTTIADIVSQINNNEDTNATAYWDSIDGKLVIESRSSGSALINIEAGTSNFTDIMGYTTSEWNSDGTLKSTRMNVETQTLGSNAQFRINGTTYTASSNTITSDITRLKGVTLNLNGLTAGSSVKVTVEKDKESVATALSDVVDSYNELMKNVDEALSAEGQLQNQTTLKMIRNQLRSLMTSSDMGATVFRNLDAIGISVDSASASNISTLNESIINLTFDKEKFLDAYESDADAVKALLIGGTDNKGIFTQVETLLENALQSVSGYFAITEKSYQRQITNLNNKITKENNYIEKYRARLEKKFSSMDLLIGQMQQQYSSFLTF